jgi:hypothetical protein
MSQFKLVRVSESSVSNPSGAFTDAFAINLAGQLFSKDQAGTVTYYSVVAESIQDIVAALIQDSSTIQKNYDDVNNILSLSVISTAINHQDLQNIGTNTHVQIDSHIASTSNPHGVTKSQVGLGNVDNTSDANKAISNATQLALNNKYETSNPNGYETPSQLNTRDTNNRNRSNHTGTQIASTISDFTEAAQDAVGAALTNSTSVAFSYPDVSNQITANVIEGGINHNNLLNAGSSTAHAVATTSVAGFMSAADKTKLDGLQNEVVLKNTATLTNTSNATGVNVTQLGIPVTNGVSYYFKALILFQSAATTTGIGLTMSAVTATGSITASAEMPISNNTGTDAYSKGRIPSLNTYVTSTAVGATAETYGAVIEGVFNCTTTGTLLPQFRSEVNGSQITIQSNSLMFYRVL